MPMRPVGPVDNLWLGMDTPENLMMIESVIWFSEPLDVERAIAVLDERLPQRYPVFRQHPISTSNPMHHAVWADDTNFDIHDHVVVAELPAPGDQAQLQTYVESLMGKPMRRDQALWEVHLLQGYGTGSAMVCRFHHAMADGTALARVVLELTDPADTDIAPEDPLIAPARAFDGSTNGARLPGRVLGVATDTVRDLSSLATSTARTGLNMFSKLPEIVDPARWIDVAQLVPETGKTAAKLLGTTLPETAFSGTASVNKNARWAQPITLVEVKRIAKAHDATVNDVMVAALAGSLRTYLELRGQQAKDVGTMVPVNLRPLDKPLPAELGNQFALVLLSLPLETSTISGRIAETKRRMNQIKDSHEPVLTFGVITTLGTLSELAARAMVDFFAGKAIGVTTNVPGPRDARLFAGTPVAGALGWAPGAGNQTLNSCIFSISGLITVGFKSDAAVISDPEALVQAFDDEIAAMLASL